jgi:hypothetical protein
MNVFTLRPSAPARKIRRAGGRAVNWLRAVISRRGAEAQSFLQWKSFLEEDVS